MANQMTDPAREGFALNEIGWNAADIRVALLRGYTFNNAHKFLSEVTSSGGTIVSRSPNISTRTATGGVLNGASVTFSSVPLGSPCQALMIYVFNASDAAARIIGYLDDTPDSSLPVTPNGSNIVLNWDTGVNKIVRLLSLCP